MPIEIRQSKHLHTIVEQDHVGNKGVVRPMLGCKSFRSAARNIAGIETIHVIRMGHRGFRDGQMT